MTSFGDSGDISRLAIFVFRHGVSVVTHLEVDVEVEVEGGEAGRHAPHRAVPVQHASLHTADIKNG